MDKLLPVNRSERGTERTGSVDTEETALSFVAAVGKVVYTSKSADYKGFVGEKSMDISEKLTRTLVELGGEPHESSAAKETLRAVRVVITRDTTAAVPELLMNCRMWNRTYGGVRGR